MSKLFPNDQADAKTDQEEIRLRAAYFEAIVACLRVAKGQDGVDRAIRKSLHAAMQSFRAYLAWQRQQEVIRNPIGYTVRHTRLFVKTLYGMISGNERSWAHVLAEADRIPGDRIFTELKRLSPFDGNDVIIVKDGEVKGNFNSFFANLESGVQIWKMSLGKAPNAPLFITLRK